MCGSKSKTHKAQHIVSAWSDTDGFCLGQKAVEEKTNEIEDTALTIKEFAEKYNSNFNLWKSSR